MKSQIRSAISNYTCSMIVLTHGREFTAAEPNEDVMPGEPFEARMKQALASGMLYVEGFAGQSDNPLSIEHHAWCVEEGLDLAIDPTGHDYDYYYGVSFQSQFVKKFLLTRRQDPTHPRSILICHTKEIYTYREIFEALVQ